MGETLYIKEKADKKLSAYLRLAENEISGFGIVEIIDGDPVVVDVFILEQESGAAHTEIDSGALHELMYTMLRERREHDLEKIALWWHSHGSGSTFFSNTDDDTIDSFGGLERPWMFSIVGNRKLEFKTQLDFYSPMRATYDDIQLRRYDPVDLRLERRIEREIKEKVRKPEPINLTEDWEAPFWKGDRPLIERVPSSMPNRLPPEPQVNGAYRQAFERPIPPRVHRNEISIEEEIAERLVDQDSLPISTVGKANEEEEYYFSNSDLRRRRPELFKDEPKGKN